MYDGTIEYFNVNYIEFAEEFYCLSAESVDKIAELFEDDWFSKQFEGSMQFYFDGQTYTIADASNIRVLGNKTTEYGAFIITRASTTNTQRDFYLCMINLETGNALPWCPQLNKNMSDWGIMGVANTTPNTKLLMVGYNSKWELLYTTIMRNMKNGEESQCMCSGFTLNSGKLEMYIADMNGTFTKKVSTTKYQKTAVSSGVPFKYIYCLIVGDNDNVYASIGDVFTSLVDTGVIASKIKDKDEVYCRYSWQGTDKLQLWFRAYRNEVV